MTNGQRRRGRPRQQATEERLAIQQSLAVELIGHLCALEQAGRLYDINNSMVQKVLQETLTTVHNFAQATGAGTELSIAGHSVFVNRHLVRPSFAEYRRAEQLRTFWDQFGIGEIRLPPDVDYQGLVEFATLLFAAMNDPHLRPSLFSREPGGIQLRPADADDRPGERADPHQFTIRVFCALLALTQYMEERVRAGRRPPMLRIKRTLQVIVDLLDGEEQLLLTLTRSPEFRGGLPGHLVGTTVLALAVGRRLGMTRSNLMALGTASLFHDLPKAGLKDEALNQLEQPATVPAEDRRRVEHLWLKVLRRVVDLGSFGEEMLARLAVLYESQLEFARPDLFPQQQQEGQLERLSLFSRIIAICDLYDTMAWRRQGKRQRTGHYAMMTLVQTAVAGKADLAITATLVDVVGLFPVGTPLLLSTGEVVVVTRPTGNLERPEVHMIYDARGTPVDGPVIDLTQDTSRNVLWPLTTEPLGINPVACFKPR
jgi:HD-GYP domain-containing protein (c-di-GMP phosphodiesterase class II)